MRRPSAWLATICLISGTAFAQQDAPPDGHPAVGRYSLVSKDCRATGAVTGPGGGPAVNATVIVLGHQYDSAMFPTLPCIELARGKTDGQGRYAIGFRPLSTANHYVCVLADGCGVEFQSFEPKGDEVAVSAASLAAELPVHGRLLAPDGTPAGHVTVEVTTIRTDRYPHVLGKARTPDAEWPLTALSDAEGRFVLRSIPKNAKELWLRIDDERYAPLEANRFGGEAARSMDGIVALNAETPGFELRLSPARVVYGTVVRKDTGAPLAGAWVGAVMAHWSVPGDSHPAARWGKTDANGKFRIRCGLWGPNLCLYAFAPRGVPCPDWAVGPIKWEDGASSREARVEMPTGTLVRGKVVEAGTGLPVPGASLVAMLRREGTKTMSFDDASRIYWANEYHRRYTAADGSFEQPVASGELTTIMVKAPNGGYVSQTITNGDIQFDRPGGIWYVVEAAQRVSPKRDEEASELTIELTKGVTLRGVVTGPGGEKIGRGYVIRAKPVHTQDNQAVGPVIWGEPIADGDFSLPGCDPDAPAELYFLEPERQWGATRIVTPGPAPERLAVALEPCGSARVRLLKPDGKLLLQSPASGFPRVGMALVFREYPEDAKYGGTYHMQADPAMFDFARYGWLASGADGTVVFPTLIPGAPYRLLVSDGRGRPPGRRLPEYKVTVKAGETTELGEITVRGDE